MLGDLGEGSSIKSMIGHWNGLPREPSGLSLTELRKCLDNALKHTIRILEANSCTGPGADDHCGFLPAQYILFMYGSMKIPPH